MLQTHTLPSPHFGHTAGTVFTHVLKRYQQQTPMPDTVAARIQRAVLLFEVFCLDEIICKCMYVCVYV